MTAGLKGSVDHIIVDPPFLSEDCQTKGKFSFLLLLLFFLIFTVTDVPSCYDSQMAVKVLGRRCGLG